MSPRALHPAVPRFRVRDAGMVVDDDGDTLPCLVLDVDADRPVGGGLADLPAAVARHGEGDLSTELTLLADRALLMVSSTSPVRSRFVVEVPLPASQPVLAAGAAAGRLVLATMSADGSADDAGWLAVNLDGSTVRQALLGG